MELDRLDILDLLKKIQESTSEDIDEEKGSFKEGGRVIYNLYGGGLTNSDLIKTLGINEHATRVNHHGKEAVIVEAEGDKVSRYNIRFDDGFSINGVSVSELKSVEEGTREFKPGEKIEAFGDTYQVVSVGKEHLLVQDSHGEETSVKKSDVVESKTNEAWTNELTGEAGDLVDLLTAKQGWAVADQLQDILKLQDTGVITGGRIEDLDLNSNAVRIIYRFLKTRTEAAAEEAAQGIEEWVEEGYGPPDVIESKTNEAEVATDTMKPQEKPDINAEDYHMEDYSEEDFNKPDAKIKSKSPEKGDAIRKVEDDELKIEPDKVVEPKKESKLKEQKDVLVRIAGGEDEGKSGVVRNWVKGLGYQDVYFEGKKKQISYEYLKVGDKTAEEFDKEVSESKFSFMKKQKSLWLCNDCFKTFRAGESKCTECESENVEKIVELKGMVGFIKHVYQVDYEKDGVEDSIRVEAFDDADAKEMVKRTNPGVEITGVKKIGESKVNEKFYLVVTPDPEFGTWKVVHNIWPHTKHGGGQVLKSGFETKENAIEWAEGKGWEEEIVVDEAPPVGKESKKVNEVIWNVGDEITHRGRAGKVVAKGGAPGSYKVHFEDTNEDEWVDISDSKKVSEGVDELIDEIPEIGQEERLVLKWAIQQEVVPNEWPDNLTLINALKAVEKQIPEEELKDPDPKILYLKYSVLPRAKREYEKVHRPVESKVEEQEGDQQEPEGEAPAPEEELPPLAQDDEVIGEYAAGIPKLDDETLLEDYKTFKWSVDSGLYKSDWQISGWLEDNLKNLEGEIEERGLSIPSDEEIKRDIPKQLEQPSESKTNEMMARGEDSLRSEQLEEILGNLNDIQLRDLIIVLHHTYPKVRGAIISTLTKDAPKEVEQAIKEQQVSFRRRKGVRKKFGDLPVNTEFLYDVPSDELPPRLCVKCSEDGYKKRYSSDENVYKIAPEIEVEALEESNEIKEGIKDVIGVYVEHVSSGRWDVVLQDQYGIDDSVKQFDDLEDAEEKAKKLATWFSVNYQGVRARYPKGKKTFEAKKVPTRVIDRMKGFAKEHNMTLDELWVQLSKEIGKKLEGVKEQEKDTFRTAAKGIEDKGNADEIARRERGMVITDPEDKDKFAVIVKESKIHEDVKVGDVVRIEDLEGNEVVSASKVTSIRDDIWREDTYPVIKTENSGDEEYHGATYMFIKESRKIREKVGGKIVGKTPTGDVVAVPEDEFLNALSKGIGDAGYGYWFSGEERHEGKMIFEFISSEAPKIELIVHGGIKED